MWALILHGGAKKIDSEETEAHRIGCLRAIHAGQEVLVNRGSAVDAVEAAIRELEANPTFNAGFGSALNADGEVEMCSAIMEGSGFNIGGVTAIKGVNHPISVARALLDEKPILLTAEGARRFAGEKGCETCDPSDLIPPDHIPRSSHAHDTVGCVALDGAGRLAVGTSTGGLAGYRAGRVGDSALPGCGYYVDNDVGGVALSGDGEHIARRIVAARVMQNLTMSDPACALQAALDEVSEIGGEAGGILLTPQGQFAWEHNSPDFAIAYHSSSMGEPACHTNKKETRHDINGSS